MKRIWLLLAATAAVLAFSAIPGAQASGHSSQPVAGSPGVLRTSTFDYSDIFYNGFMTDPSDGGLNTLVVAETGTASNAKDWSLQANGTCGGKVTSTCPGGWWSAHIQGFFIVTLRNIGQGTLCFGANAQGGWDGTMSTCDGVNGLHHYNTLFAWEPNDACGSSLGTAFLSYQWNKNGGTQAAFITDAAGPGPRPGLRLPNGIITVIEGSGLPHCTEALWTPTGS